MLKNKILLCISIILLLCLILFDGYKIYQNKRLEQSDIVSMHMSDIMEIWYLSNDLCNLLDSNSEQQYRLMLINSTLHRFTRRLGPILQLDNSEDSLRMYQFFDKLCEKINKLEANGDIKRLDEVLEQEFSMNTENYMSYIRVFMMKVIIF